MTSLSLFLSERDPFLSLSLSLSLFCHAPERFGKVASKDERRRERETKIQKRRASRSENPIFFSPPSFVESEEARKGVLTEMKKADLCPFVLPLFFLFQPPLFRFFFVLSRIHESRSIMH